MKIKHEELEIPSEKPFAHCKLERESYAKVLTEILNKFSDGFVLAINNEWGTGKTTFVKMWQQYLKNVGFKTIYFNAWENDFNSDPLVAFMSELEPFTNAKNKAHYNSALEKGAILMKNIGPVLAKSLTKKYLGDLDQTLPDLIENSTKASMEILEAEVKKFKSKKENIVEFRKKIENFISQSEDPRPIIFIVDELDRCKPSYSVEVLEQIKHLFSVSGIVFVLSIDKKNLSSAIKGYYGSDLIDSNEYLRRFIDLEYSIPKPKPENFIKYLYNYYSFDDFFASHDRRNIGLFKSDARNFYITALHIISHSSPTLRQIEKIFSLTRLSLCSFNGNDYAYPHLLFLLVYIKIMKDDLFIKFENHEFSLQELNDKFDEMLIEGVNENIEIDLIFIKSQLLWFYNNNSENRKRSSLLGKDSQGNPSTPIIVSNEKAVSNLAKGFLLLDREPYGHVKLDYLLNKIKLTDPITFY